MNTTIDFSEVRAILLKEWDPLNVEDNALLADEYDSYIPEIIKLICLGSNTAASPIIKYLEGIELSLGITTNKNGRIRAAKRLIEAVK